ncbi:hypothetical protein L596_014017 [Steinernema carpocapsae]|uniref:Translation elongation factor EF1B beta/delta subunit guanine nucleotide exchange domain-containing protein n=1 Tax=Steinernema carpocapsae TaxID=34508 RepID=A0A4U5NAF4_STECR|nr:hypothetical protein L596_014017 [Steinernema carpocapsae]
MSSLKAELNSLRAELAETRKVVQGLVALVKVHLASDAAVESSKAASAPVAEEKKEEAAAAEESDLDLFGSDDDEDDEEKKRITEERLKAYAEKKSKKPGPIAKSSVILDVKPWDDETDLGEMEKLVRSIEQDGLVWGGAKLIPLAFGIKKLQIICVIEDLKVSVDDLIEKITSDFDEHVQSVDIAAFNKI